MDSSFGLQRAHVRGSRRGRGHCGAPWTSQQDTPQGGYVDGSKEGDCRCPAVDDLAVVEDPHYCRAGAAFDARNLPHVSCRGKTVHHREVERRPIGSAFGTAIAERRRGSPETSTVPSGMSRCWLVVMGPLHGLGHRAALRSSLIPIRGLLEGIKHRLLCLGVGGQGVNQHRFYLLPLDSQLEVYGSGAVKLP